MASILARADKDFSAINGVFGELPKQALGRLTPYRYKCPWWSVGVVLHEMLRGRGPFETENDAALMYKILREPPAASEPVG